MSKKPVYPPIDPVFFARAPFVLAGNYFDRDRITSDQAVEEFLTRFGTGKAEVEKEGYRPLFIAYGQSYGGEPATSFALFEKKGRLYEVHGEESSIEDFNGQWEPEETYPAALHHALVQGSLGWDDEQDQFNTMKRFPCGNPSP
jgi:hypothetical protein